MGISARCSPRPRARPRDPCGPPFQPLHSPRTPKPTTAAPAHRQSPAHRNLRTRSLPATRRPTDPRPRAARLSGDAFKYHLLASKTRRIIAARRQHVPLLRRPQDHIRARWAERAGGVDDLRQHRRPKLWLRRTPGHRRRSSETEAEDCRESWRELATGAIRRHSGAKGGEECRLCQVRRIQSGLIGDLKHRPPPPPHQQGAMPSVLTPSSRPHEPRRRRWRGWRLRPHSAVEGPVTLPSPDRAPSQEPRRETARTSTKTPRPRKLAQPGGTRPPGMPRPTAF